MSRHITFVRALLATAALSPVAAAQFNNQWVTFAPDQSRLRDALGNAAGYITGDQQEKDMAWGDLNHDGWTDLVIVRKQPFTTGGAYPNYLLMNEGGLLVDRSAQYASASDVGGDNGFLTATNDRDVVFTDVNLDTWLDVVTVTTLGDGQPKHISHPRVYMNLGDDANGNWLGLRFENNRIPTFSLAPHFCGGAAGDVTGDGYPDLYFADYGNLSDKLLINNGSGFFTDSGTSRMNATMMDSAFGTAADIVDMNGDGARDVVRASGVTGVGAGPMVSVAYNNPANVGFFNIYQSPVGSGAPYHVDVGDLNNDNKPDIIVSDDGSDAHRYNTGVDALGRVIWGPVKSYEFLTGGDDGFAGSNLIVDIDGDGWKDAIHADVDVDIGGCGRRGHIYHNPGGAIGGQITLREEAQQASGGWRGVVGMQSSDLTGTFDVACFDIDNDGDKDMVFGRCSGTFLWMNQQYSCPQGPYAFGSPVLNSAGTAGRLSMTGTSSISANNMVLRGTGFPPNKSALFIYGTQRLWNGPVPFGNGLRYIGGSIQRMPGFFTDGIGEATFAANMNAFPLNTVPAGATRDFQLWYRDPPAGGAMYNVSDALEIVFCP